MFYFTAASALVLTVSVGSSNGTPKQRTEGLIEACVEVSEAIDADKNTPKIYMRFDEFCDFNHMTDTAIAPHVAKLSQTQLKTYKDTFTELIRLVAFPNSGRAFQKGGADIQTTKINNGDATVMLVVDKPEEDIELEVLFHWKKKDKKWMLIDVDFDGASLTKDYQNQFGRIISKSGVDKLLNTLKKKLKQEKAKIK